MNPLNYENNEEQFLEAMATRFGFSGKTWLVFVQRLLSANADLTNKALGEVLERDLINGASTNTATIVRDRLKAICQKLAEEGCDFGEVTKGKWKLAKKWLREDIYPQWIQTRTLPKVDKFWLQLWEKANLSNLIKPIFLPNVGFQNLDLNWGTKPKNQAHSISVNSKIHYQVELNLSGYLILLEKFTSDEIWCLSPSCLLPDFPLPVGVTTIPHQNSINSFFTVEGSPGVEEIVAIITPHKPSLDWLPTGEEEPLQLDESHLHDLLSYLEGDSNSQVMKTQYQIVS